MADPTSYLSTMTATSAALVSIVGGLLVARFVGLDSEQQGAQKLMDDAQERLGIAQRRAAEANSEVMRWDAGGFLRDPKVLQAIKSGTTGLDQLRELADSSLEDPDLGPFVAEVAAEFQTARNYFENHPLSPTEKLFEAIGTWYRSRRVLPNLPQIRWEEAWELVFDETALRAAEAAAKEARQREAEAERRRKATTGQEERLLGSLAGITGAFSQLHAPLLQQGRTFPAGLMAIAPSASSSTDWQAIRARRYDDLVTTRERASQRVEDLEAELARLRLDHKRVVMPDSRLVWGLVVLAVFTMVGVVVPLWVMSNGPHDITPHIRLLFWGFSVALAFLFGYMVIYLVKLMTRKSTPASADDLG
ncbi:hypothetical protein [Kitasatospora sp. GAS1066B]|uniref:hypothetical protein n=1 Tax=Kitasatospora sp. GAS1066B TaxID=3156271 RepID=UPI003514D6A5